MYNTLYNLSFLVLINVDDLSCIPKNHDRYFLADFAVFVFFGTGFAFKNPRSRLFLCLSSVLLYPCFVKNYLPKQKIVTFAMEKRQLDLESTTRFLLFSTMSKRGTRFAEIFFIGNFSNNIENNVLWDTTGTSNISWNLIHRSLNSKLWILSHFVNHFRKNRFHWKSETIFIICVYATTLKHLLNCK